MVARQHYRWDFIGLSTDNKPTPTTSEKVVDGSTFYCSDNSKLYVWYKTQWYEKTVSGGGGGTSDFDQLTNRPMYDGVAMTSETNIPEVITYTAGSNITISDGEISATDTTYSNFTGTDGTAAGAAGLVPAPATTDAGKFLKADGTWDTAGGGSGPTVVQTPGTSTTDVMSQNAVTSMVFADPETQYKIKIGAGSSSNEGSYAVEIGDNSAAGGTNSCSIGHNSKANGTNSVALGEQANGNGRGAVAIGQGSGDGTSTYNVSVGSVAKAKANGAIAIGYYSTATQVGEMNIGCGQTTYGYNNSNYRLLSGVYDGQSAHDAATVGQITPLTDSSAPTTATVGRLGQIFIDTTNADAYMCVTVDSVTPSYTWKKINA